MPRAKQNSNGWLSWMWRGRQQVKRPRTRVDGFMAGYNDGLAASKRDRLTEDWQPRSLSPTSLHRFDNNLLLRRARDLVENNPFAKSGVESYTANVIGCGITPKPLHGDPAQRAKWVDAWNWWGGEYENEADITGTQHIYELMALWLSEIITGGGCLVRYVPVDPDRYRRQRIKISLELIPEERFADEKDDLVLFQTRQKSGNPIIRGVEYDAATGRAVGYWVRPTHPSDSGMAFDPVRYDAQDCHYSFFKQRIGQFRGLSMLRTAIIWLWKLGYYVDNELMASAIKSCFATIVRTDYEDADFEGLDDDSHGACVVDMNNNPLEKLEPGIIARLKGKDANIQGVGPNTPGSDQEAWILLIERSIAIAMGLSYEGLMRDYSRGSFSSVRAGMNEDRQRYRPLQRFTINHFCRPTYGRFAAAAATAGIDGFPRPSEFVANFDELMRCKWRPPGWQSVNPFDDARAGVLEIQHGLGTRDGYTSSKGDDWEEIDDQAEREAESATRHQLHYGAPAEMDITPSQQTQADTAGKTQPGAAGA